MNPSDVLTPQIGRVRAYFAPVNRSAGQATLFDPSRDGRFPLDAPPAPWVDLGFIHAFQRRSETLVGDLKTGSPAMPAVGVRSAVEATVSFDFQSWGKLQLSLAAGMQHMNVLRSAGGVAGRGSGGQAAAAVVLNAGSTASALDVGEAAGEQILAGMLLAVDVDYANGLLGFVGAGTSGGFVKTPLADPDYIRRVTLNVARVASVEGGLLTLVSPLPAGDPTAGMKASVVEGYCDREGSTFFQEWSGLFVCEGQQGERVIWHYPRLQANAGVAEQSVKSSGGYAGLLLKGSFRALPVVDAVDGERIVCFRSYIPG